MAALLSLGVLRARAQEVSIADIIPDPGFETAHQSNQQLNVSGAESVNGWRTTPMNGNAWTSISYVDANTKTPGDGQNAISPAEGGSYLRMYTKNSWDWLSLSTPTFPMVNGTAYVVSFKVAADAQFPMSKLSVGLRSKVTGVYYGLVSYDLTTLEPGWNTLVYRCLYDGPSEPGILQLTGRREKQDKIGSLNLDDFKTPSRDEKTSAKISVVPQPKSPAR